MEKYLYLTRREWASTWVSGGEIPIVVASTYRSAERSGTRTPDENTIHESNVDAGSLLSYGISVRESQNVYIGSVVSPSGDPSKAVKLDVHIRKYLTEDGLILSLCNSKSSDICHRLGKQACVKILDVHNLKRLLDEQLGCESTMGACEYTYDHQRNHFLKSSSDAWQDEFRLFWPITRNAVAKLPAGVAKQIKMRPR